MNWYIRRQLILAPIGILAILIFFRVLQKDSSITYDEIVQHYRIEEYSGLVIDKYVDEDEHNYQKVILQHEYGERTIVFNHETGSIFSFIEVNDSLIKEIDTLAIRIIRENLDTLITMKFDKWITNPNTR